MADSGFQITVTGMDKVKSNLLLPPTLLRWAGQSCKTQ
jgi:hypothetical protein